jgi:KaiC/GvpD/RAD55 family RecA-like ATPase
MSAWQMLQGGGYTNPVVSLPSATPSKDFWDADGVSYKYLNSFDKIVLSLDNDKAGRKVAEVMFDLFPDKVFTVDHGSYKDANEFLQAGQAKEYKDRVLWKSKKYAPAGFTSGAESFKDAVFNQKPYPTVETEYEDLNKAIRGWLAMGTTVIKAPRGTGKTSLVRAIMYDLAVRKGKKVAALLMEEVDGLTARAMATYHLGKNVNTTEDQLNSGVSDEELADAIDEIWENDNIVTFTVDPSDPIESCLKQAKYASAVYEADFIFIDHLQKLAYMAGTETATEKLTSLVVNLNELGVRREVGFIALSQVSESGKAKYAMSIEEEAYVILNLERNKETGNTDIFVDKNRPFAYIGPAGSVEYNFESTIVTPASYLGDF